MLTTLVDQEDLVDPEAAEKKAEEEKKAAGPVAPTNNRRNRRVRVSVYFLLFIIYPTKTRGAFLARLFYCLLCVICILSNCFRPDKMLNSLG